MKHFNIHNKNMCILFIYVYIFFFAGYFIVSYIKNENLTRIDRELKKMYVMKTASNVYFKNSN